MEMCSSVGQLKRKLGLRCAAPGGMVSASQLSNFALSQRLMLGVALSSAFPTLPTFSSLPIQYFSKAGGSCESS